MPGATYRVQLHAEFDFEAAARISDYLSALGVTHLYCSPYFQSVAGSTHGYDVVDPVSFNVELGGAPGHARLVGALHDAALGQVLDIVPNHMGTDPANRWWWDVLENGQASRYARYFDIDWDGPDDRAAFTVLAPVLGDHYGRILDAGELHVTRARGAFELHYHEHRLPISPRTIDQLLAAAARRVGSAEVARLAADFGALPDSRITDHAAVAERHTAKLHLEAELAALCERNELVAAAIDAEIDALVTDPDRFDALLRRQNYRLSYWRTASDDLDYRRFFNIESLVGVRVDDPDVFAATHALVLELVREGTLDGLRVDHVDGLRDPAAYLDMLADATAGTYTVVEKILEGDEELPGEWSVAGTSGYDFVTRVNNLFVVSEHEADMSDCYGAFSGESVSYREVVYASKNQIMREDLAAEVERLTGLLVRVCDDHRRHRDHTRRDLRAAVREFVAQFPVYRTYLRRDRAATDAERAHIEVAVRAAIDRRDDLDDELFEFLGALAAGEYRGSRELEFAERLQQLTAPVMAKGVEDTAFYRYHRLVSLNEVGGDPGVFGRPVAAFHEATMTNAKRWPRSLSTLSTHDTKRSADVRARLNVLSEVPGAWREATQQWADHNDALRRGVWPDRNAEYLLYQTLVGAWPIDAERVVAFMRKATREAKVHTSWLHPVAAYDDELEAFIRRVMGDESFVLAVRRFLDDQRIVERGYRNSLSQVALLLTCPGVPDLYQGTELWDLSLVDPDNRRPVDYERRRALLAQLHDSPDSVVDNWAAGGPKLALVHRVLQYRAQHRSLVESDRYEPLPTDGARAGDVVAFGRDEVAVCAPCRTREGWGDTAVSLPAGEWVHLVTGVRHRGGRQPLAELLRSFPVAVLAREGR